MDCRSAVRGFESPLNEVHIPTLAATTDKDIWLVRSLRRSSLPELLIRLRQIQQEPITELGIGEEGVE